MNRFGRSFASQVSSIRPARLWVMEVAGQGWPQNIQRVADIGLVTSELVTNATEHGNGADLAIAIDTSERHLTLTVTSGRKQTFPVVSDPSPDSSAGRGLHIVSNLSQSFAVESDTGFVRVSVGFEMADEQSGASFRGMGSPETLTIGSQDGTLALSGELDASSAALCQAALEAMQPTDGQALVDVSGITFIDSTGLRVFVKAHQRAESGSVKLVLLDASPTVLRLMEITGLIDYLHFATS